MSSKLGIDFRKAALRTVFTTLIAGVAIADSLAIYETTEKAMDWLSAAQRAPDPSPSRKPGQPDNDPVNTLRKFAQVAASARETRNRNKAHAVNMQSLDMQTAAHLHVVETPVGSLKKTPPPVAKA